METRTEIMQRNNIIQLEGREPSVWQYKEELAEVDYNLAVSGLDFGTIELLEKQRLTLFDQIYNMELLQSQLN